jgi:hypothetical protein
MTRKFTSAFAALIMAIVATFTVTTPARAAAADCPAGLFCMWVDANYSGARYQVSWQTIIDGPNNGIVVGWITDIASSMYNRTPYTIRMHAHDNCGTLGWSRAVPAGQRLTAPGSAVNDRVEALQFESAYPLPC